MIKEVAPYASPSEGGGFFTMKSGAKEEGVAMITKF